MDSVPCNSLNFSLSELRLNSFQESFSQQRQVIRILSDLHWGHKASLIRASESLEGLVREADKVIFNGDTLEQKFEDSPCHLDKPLPRLAEFRDLLESWEVEPLFLTGNHDPRISNTHYCELNGGEILITHGDAIFPTVAPWSANRKVLENAVARGLASSSATESFYSFLQVFKDASLEEQALVKDYDPTVWGKIQIFLRQAWPPTRAFTILECWREAPKKAIELVEKFQKRPRFLIIGHTHKPDITVNGSTTVINTGSFLPWPGATTVDIDSSSITVRKVIKRQGRFTVGDVIGRFEVAIDLDSLLTPIEASSKAHQSTEQTVSA
jgi:predicted phosphodiesterase